jgi:hypothetical protein
MARNLPSSGVGLDCVAATQHDSTVDPNGPFRGFILSAEGALKIQTLNDTTRTFASGIFAAQTIYEIGFTRVWDTGTDAITVYGIK